MGRGLTRIVMHWSAGADSNQDDDREHYHFIVTRSGKQVAGVHKPEANVNIKNGIYAAHTRGLNTGSIGVAMDAMRGAIESPFEAGPEPITGPQLLAFVQLVADLAMTYEIPVTPKTILTHAEVQPTLGVVQRGKWDITWLPGMKMPSRPIDAGSLLRRMVSDELARMKALTPSKRWGLLS